MDILKRPIITEKMTGLGEKLGKYGFLVDRRANKLEIKDAVEKMYGVTVKSIQTMTNPGKTKSRNTRTSISHGQSSALKKAVVTLAEGNTINFYSNI